METGSDSGNSRRRVNTGTKGKDVRLSRGSSRGPATDEDSSDRRISSRPSRQAAQQNQEKGCSFLKLARILMEHIEIICSLEPQLSFVYICSIEILSRTRDISKSMQP